MTNKSEHFYFQSKKCKKVTKTTKTRKRQNTTVTTKQMLCKRRSFTWLGIYYALPPNHHHRCLFLAINGNKTKPVDLRAGKTNQAIAPNISPSSASNFPTKSQEKAAIKSIGGSSKLGVGDMAAPLRFPLQANTQRTEEQGAGGVQVWARDPWGPRRMRPWAAH